MDRRAEGIACLVDNVQKGAGVTGGIKYVVILQKGWLHQDSLHYGNRGKSASNYEKNSEYKTCSLADCSRSASIERG